MFQDNIQIFLQQFLVSEVIIKIGFSVVVALIGYLIFSRVSNYWLQNVLQKVVENGNLKKSRERQIKNWSLFIDRTGGIVILFILLLTVLSDLNYNIVPLLTGAGIVGVAIGLGSQNFMKDVVGGIFVFLEGNYSEGDRVKIAGVAGKVKKISMRKTILYSEEDKTKHIIPHSEVKTISILPKDAIPEQIETEQKKAPLSKKKTVVKD
jgi:moderate conductance mechanosensitive channel